MLIEFRVSNYRSIRDEQILSFVASNYDKTLPGALIDRPLAGLSGFKYVPVVALYGANASGKTNVLRAFGYLSYLIMRSANFEPSEDTGVEPFKLQAESVTQPTTFELTFEAEGVRYQFYVALNAKQVLAERLVAYPAGRPQRWYSRSFQPDSKTYAWTVRGRGFKFDAGIRDKTRPNALFLSTSAQWNHAQLGLVHAALRDGIASVGVSFGGQAPWFGKEPAEGLARWERALAVVGRADMGIAGISIKPSWLASWIDHLTSPVDTSGRTVVANGLANTYNTTSAALAWPHPRPVQAGADIVGELRGAFDIAVSHRIDNQQQVELDFYEEESQGTQRFLALVWPWLEALECGRCLIVDEIETSLHPLLVRELLRMFMSKETNPKGAQLVFTTHDPILLDPDLLRRDQVWFTDKGRDGATKLYPLSDFKPRKGEALSKGYLSGRYGAIPFLGKGLAE